MTHRWHIHVAQYDDLDSFFNGDVEVKDLIDIGVGEQDAATILNLAKG